MIRSKDNSCKFWGEGKRKKSLISTVCRKGETLKPKFVDAMRDDTETVDGGGHPGPRAGALALLRRAQKLGARPCLRRRLAQLHQGPARCGRVRRSALSLLSSYKRSESNGRHLLWQALENYHLLNSSWSIALTAHLFSSKRAEE